MDVGSALHQARIERGLYIPELVYRTRIRAEVIEAIERNDFSACGGDVYARGHVRALAAALDLPVEPLLEAMGAPTEASVLEAVEPESLNIWTLQERSRVPGERRLWVVAGLAAAVIVIALVWQSRHGSGQPVPVPPAPSTPAASSPAPTTPAASPTASSPSPSSSPTSAPSTSAPASPSASPVATGTTTGAVTIAFACSQTSWLRVTNASGTLFQGTLRAGDTRSFSSSSDVSVVVGNAAGITITANGTTYDHLGAAGAVYTNTFRVA